MSPSAASFLSVAALLLAGLFALADASRLPHLRWRLGPVALCGASVFWLADRGLLLAGQGMSVAQAPWKLYVPALVVVGAAITIAGLLYRVHRGRR